MDKHEAKFILSSFRPNGSDIGDPAFAKALSLAAQDIELGTWLANERSRDTAFAAALAEVPIPESLREELFGVLHQDHEAVFDELDEVFKRSLASLRPPIGLRDDIFSAMKVSSQLSNITNLPLPSTHSKRFPAWPAVAFAAVAGVAVALTMTNKNPSQPANHTFAKYTATDPHDASKSLTDNSITPVSNLISHRDIQLGAIRFLDSDFQLDRTDPKQEELFQHLASNKLPIPDDLPPGLKNAKGIGCREIAINDHKASLICFQQTEGSPIVHLVVMKRSQVKDKSNGLQKAKGNCHQCKVTGWSMASWESEENAYFILSKAEPQTLASFF